MMAFLRQVHQTANRQAGKILLLGLLGVAWRNWGLLQRDLANRRGQAHRVAPPSLEAWPTFPTVSVLIAAWNEAENLDECLRSFRALRYPNKELVLCAGGGDGTYAWARQQVEPGVIVLEQRPGEGKQRAVQRCLQRAKGEIVVLSDADCVLNETALEWLIYPLVIGEELVSTGTSRPVSRQGQNPFVRNQWAPFHYVGRLDAEPYGRGLLGRNCALVRPVLEEAWGDDEEVPSGTDFYLALQVRQKGRRIARLMESSVETEFPASFGTYVRQQARWLRNLFVLGWRFSDGYHLRHAALASLSGAAMLGMPLLPILAGRAGLVAWGLGWTGVIAARLRYLVVLNADEGAPVFTGVSFGLLKVVVGDLLARSLAPVEACSLRGRRRW